MMTRAQGEDSGPRGSLLLDDDTGSDGNSQGAGEAGTGVQGSEYGQDECLCVYSHLTSWRVGMNLHVHSSIIL